MGSGDSGGATRGREATEEDPRGERDEESAVLTRQRKDVLDLLQNIMCGQDLRSSRLSVDVVLAMSR
jgi:hypothetical protein